MNSDQEGRSPLKNEDVLQQNPKSLVYVLKMPSLSNLSLYFQDCVLVRVSPEFLLEGTFPEETG